MASIKHNAHATSIMEAFLISTLAVAVGEIGDKTQLLALLLAARYRKLIPIVLGILVATLVNPAWQVYLVKGAVVVRHISPELLRCSLGAAFIAIAIWTLNPDKMEDEGIKVGQFGVLFAICLTFFSTKFVIRRN